jgi:tRNA (guanine37-N1)-methyltransferase
LHFHVISIFPEMITQASSHGVVGQAIQDGKVRLQTLNPRQFSHGVHQAVDDRPFGGGDGMVMTPEPLTESVALIKKQITDKNRKARVIYLSARGRPLTDVLVQELSKESDLILICGRYGGVDQRVLSQTDAQEISIGDYVLSGGELGALVIIDAVSRGVSGVLGNALSPVEESFRRGLLEHPQFTRPRSFQGLEVPAILLSGDHQKIKNWQRSLAILTTAENRPDLLGSSELSAEEVREALAVFQKMSQAERSACGLTSDSRAMTVLNEYLKAQTK